MVAGGLSFEQDRCVFKVDVAYQTSRSVTENFNAEVGQRVPTVFVEFDDNNGPSFTLDPSIPLSSENVSLRNSINQNFSAGEGSLFQARMDSEYELEDRKSTRLNSSHYCASRMSSSA